jgi:hypothetical protein
VQATLLARIEPGSKTIFDALRHREKRELERPHRFDHAERAVIGTSGRWLTLTFDFLTFDFPEH